MRAFVRSLNGGSDLFVCRSEQLLRCHPRRQNQHASELLAVAASKVRLVASNQRIAFECDGGSWDMPVFLGSH